MKFLDKTLGHSIVCRDSGVGPADPVLAGPLLSDQVIKVMLVLRMHTQLKHEDITTSLSYFITVADQHFIRPQFYWCQPDI